jgi:3-phenylpropionate/cinnamic acid dioxygenase small subunit
MSAWQPGQAIPTNHAVYAEVAEFLYSEAELLDSRRYSEWMRLMTADMQYTVPMLQDLKGRKADSASRMDWIDDDFETLRLRVARLDTEYAYSEHPPSRVRHMVTNIRVRATVVPEEFDVVCNLLVYRNQGGQTVGDIFCGERRDVLRKVSGAWRLAKRTLTLDQTLIGTGSLGIPL